MHMRRSAGGDYNSRAGRAPRQDNGLVKAPQGDSFLHHTSGSPANRSRRYMDDDEDEEEDYVPRGKYPSSATSATERPSTSNTVSNTVSSKARGYDDDEDDDDDSRWEGAVARASIAGQSEGAGRARDREEAVLRALESAKLAAPAPLNLTNMREFLCAPVPRAAGPVLCYIKRNKSGPNRLFPLYTLWLKVTAIASTH